MTASMLHGFNVAGLLINFLAAIMVTYFPPEVKHVDDSGNLIVGWSAPAPLATVRRHRVMRRVGMPMFIFGFLLQLVTALMTI